MVTLKEISNYINDDMLQTIYETREDEICELRSTENIERNTILKENPMDYDRLLLIIQNLPPHFCNTREAIIQALEEYTKRENALTSYANEKFYKAGFCDGIRTIIETLKKN